MEYVLAVAVIALYLGSLGYLIFCLGRFFWRGQRDGLWFWDNANRAGGYILLFVVIFSLFELVKYGLYEALVWVVAFLLCLVPLPHLFYAAGRFFGIWRRARRTPQP
jgi:hypothetical protein